MPQIIKKNLNCNIVKSDGIKRYIVLHDTANASPSANAYAHWDYFNEAEIGQSWDFVCDDSVILDCVPSGFCALHTGVDRFGNTKNGTVSFVSDRNSVGIGFCLCKGGDLMETIRNTAYITAICCMKYGVPKDCILRQYDIDQSIDPVSMKNGDIGLKDGIWGDFEGFKDMVFDIVERIDEAKKISHRLFKMGIIQDEQYWIKALSGNGEIEPKWVCMIINELIGE